MMYSPYNQTREYHPWGGEDCSWIYAYQGAEKSIVGNSLMLASLLVFVLSLILAGPSTLMSWTPPPLPPNIGETALPPPFLDESMNYPNRNNPAEPN
jgi:hypothetical protein